MTSEFWPILLSQVKKSYTLIHVEITSWKVVILLAETIWGGPCIPLQSGGYLQKWSSF